MKLQQSQELMGSLQEKRTNRRWLIVSLLAWGLISVLLFVRIYVVWGLIEVALMTTAALVTGGILTLIAVSLPFRIFQNVIQPERGMSQLRETVLCMFAFLSLVSMVISAIINYPPGW